jgi:hypothetical protein
VWVSPGLGFLTNILTASSTTSFLSWTPGNLWMDVTGIHGRKSNPEAAHEKRTAYHNFLSR